MAPKQIDEALLDGITFRGAEKREVKEGSGENETKKTKWIPFERPATADDVLSFRTQGAETVIVIADGRKHVVGQAGKKAEKAAEKKK